MSNIDPRDKLDAVPLDFAGEHRRQRQPVDSNEELAKQIAPPAPQSLSTSGAIFFQQVEALQAERNRLQQDLHAANARIEQFQIAANSRDSELETLRLQLQQASDAIAAEKAERIRLGNAIEMTIGTLQRSLAQPTPAPTEGQGENAHG